MKSGDYVKAVEYVAKEGLDAMEYEAVRGVRISEAKARAIGEAAKKYDVLLSMHAPYFINFASPEEQTVKKSQERLRAAVQASYWMGAYAVVFHPGYYKGNSSPEEALKRTIEGIRPVVEWMKQEGVKGVWIAPETTGKTSQVGSIEEVIAICRELEMARPAVDWAHLYARSEGKFITKIDDVIKVIEFIEKELGSWAVKPLHTHFSKIEYGRGGEREHHTLAEEEYGPDWRIVCRGYKETGIEGVIISESPILDKDALVMKKICAEEGYV
nr:deoxyribonuclease IV [Pyrofollis japonicus]